MDMHLLTSKERLVLYGLVRWPELNDIELSKRISCKRPTVTAIRNKLRERGMYADVIVPNLGMIGCEILAVRYGSFNPMKKYRSRRKYSSLNRFPEVFFKKSSDMQRIAMSAFANFTDVMRYVEYSSIAYSKNKLASEGETRHVFFPLRLSRTLRFLDYAPLLRHSFRISLPEDKPALDLAPMEDTVREFSENEKLVLYAIVKYPHLNDGEISKRVSMTRQSVNKMRRKFEKEKVIRRIRIPDVEKLGYEIMLFLHFSSNPEYTMEDRKEGIRRVLSTYPEITTLVASNLETVVIGFEKTFTDLQKDYGQFLSAYKKSNYLTKEPFDMIFPTHEIKESINGRYHPLLRKIFNIKKEV
jgi:DNA-binding Lrp family transcriptional regulator